MLCNKAQCSTVQCSTFLYSAVKCSAVSQLFFMFLSTGYVLVVATSEAGGAARVLDTNMQVNLPAHRPILSIQAGRVQVANLSPDPRERHTLLSTVLGGGLMWMSVFGVSQTQVGYHHRAGIGGKRRCKKGQGRIGRGKKGQDRAGTDKARQFSAQHSRAHQAGRSSAGGYKRAVQSWALRLGATTCHYSVAGAAVPVPANPSGGKEGLSLHHVPDGLTNPYGKPSLPQRNSCQKSLQCSTLLFQVGWLGMVLYAVYQNCDPITAGQVQGVLLINGLLDSYNRSDTD